MQPGVWLFDVDGVLVQPGGYRAAVRATINYFTNRMGLGNLAPSDDVIAIFEAQGITCEWDMIPLTLAVILEAACKADMRLDSLEGAVAALGENKPAELAIDYASQFRVLGRYAQPGLAPADAVLAACQGGPEQSPFPRLAGQGILRQLLSNSRRPALSPTTHIFETYVLGDAVYSAAMGLPADVRSEPLLARYDRPLLDPAVRDQLLAEVAQGRLRMAAYTARPSRPLCQTDERLAIYTPEAEMALELVGLGEIALVGSGQVGEAARRMDEPEDRLVKPAPYHAIAAALAALTGSLPAAMDWAGQVFQYYERGGPLPALDIVSNHLAEPLELNVFEDSPAGMAGSREAVRLLGELGVQARLRLWGIATHPEKAAALERQGARVFADVNQAVSAALEHA